MTGVRDKGKGLLVVDRRQEAADESLRQRRKVSPTRSFFERFLVEIYLAFTAFCYLGEQVLNDGL